MLQLREEYLIGFLAQFLSEMITPFGKLNNTNPQIDDIPEKFMLET